MGGHPTNVMDTPLQFTVVSIEKQAYTRDKSWPYNTKEITTSCDQSNDDIFIVVVYVMTTSRNKVTPEDNTSSHI
jgi:hypothetical protein